MQSNLFNDIPCLPFVAWVGGKRYSTYYLLPRFPKDFNNYYEPFLGMGAVFLAQYVSHRQNFISDLNEDVILVWNSIKNDFNAFVKYALIHSENHGKDYFKEVVKRLNKSKQNTFKASCFCYLVGAGFGAIVKRNLKGKYTFSWGNDVNYCVNVANLTLIKNKLDFADIKCCSYLDIKPKANDFVYLDPPYDPINIESRMSYGVREKTERQQLQIRDFCLKLHNQDVKFMLSNSNTKTYKQYIWE